jgi:hypothetical protein
MLADVELRPPAMPAGERPEDPVHVDPDAPVSYRVEGRLTRYKIAGMLALAVAAAVLGWHDRGAILMVGIGVVVLGGYAARDLLAPVRVAADLDGLTVIGGFASRHRLTWDQIERVRVDERVRFGRRAQLLEIDAGAELYLFGQAELGGPTCEQVADRLAILKVRSEQARFEQAQSE